MPSSRSDRRVHARFTDEFGAVVEIVRYDRAGKWYAEWEGGRRHLAFADAVFISIGNAKHGDGRVFTNVPGGKLFDARVAGHV